MPVVCILPELNIAEEYSALLATTLAAVTLALGKSTLVPFRKAVRFAKFVSTFTNDVLRSFPVPSLGIVPTKIELILEVCQEAIFPILI
jgi:hypothetical protein